LDARYQYLPLDTRHLPDLELEIVGLFEHLDEALDGWLIHSENYQALNTLRPRFRGRVKTIYIDPPFNLGDQADYYYQVDYRNSTWLTLLGNRLALTKRVLKDDGSIFVRSGHDGNMLVRLLMNQIFDAENYRNEIIVRRAEESKGEFIKQFGSMRSMTVNYDNIYWYSKDPDARFDFITKPISEERGKAYWHSFWKAENRPNLRYELLGIDLDRGQWMWSEDRALQAFSNYQNYCRESQETGETLEEYWKRTGEKYEFLRRKGDGISSIKYWIAPRDTVISDNSWLDIRGYANNWGFKTENSEILLQRVIKDITPNADLVLDFFLGSGTTTATAHKLNCRWIGIEMGEHFYTVVLPRMKKVLNGEQSGISKDVDWQGGGFFKYYALEQYEDTLRNATYIDDATTDAKPFADPYTDVYQQYVFLADLKQLHAIEIDPETRAARVDLAQLYPDIDLAETLANLRGKRIARLTAEAVEFEDGERIDLRDPDWDLIKPLIWW
jgi:adenine-specific DNA-methyltransferase